MRDPSRNSAYLGHDGEAYRLGELTDAQALHHAGTVHLDRAHADTEIEGDHLVRATGHQRIEDLPLTRAERGDQLGRHRRFPLLGQLLFEVRVTVGELVELDQVAGTLLEAIPAPDQLAVFGGLTRHLACAGRVVPHARLNELGFELVGALSLGRKVKGAP